MKLRQLVTRAAASMIAVLGATTVAVPAARAEGTLTVSTCGAFIFQSSANPGLSTLDYCPAGTNAPAGMSVMTGAAKVAAGTQATWQADAPAGFAITGASIPANQMYSIHINDGTGWGGGFYWAGGGVETHNGETSYGVSGLDSGYFGFKAICGWKQLQRLHQPGAADDREYRPHRHRDGRTGAQRSRRDLAGVRLDPRQLASALPR